MNILKRIQSRRPIKWTHGLVWTIIGALAIASPFITPSLLTIVLFFVGWPLIAIGSIILVRSLPRYPKWMYRQAFAIILRNPKTIPGTDGKPIPGPGPTYEYHKYDPNAQDDTLPQEVRHFAYDREYYMQLTGWTPGGRYDKLLAKIIRTIRPKRTALFIYDVETARPITHGSAETAYAAVSPEFLKKITESRLAANFSKSLDRKATTGRIWIYAIVGVVILGVVLKIAGVL